jgi:hypothetical protein
MTRPPFPSPCGARPPFAPHENISLFSDDKNGSCSGVDPYAQGGTGDLPWLSRKRPRHPRALPCLGRRSASSIASGIGLIGVIGGPAQATAPIGPMSPMPFGVSRGRFPESLVHRVIYGAHKQFFRHAKPKPAGVPLIHMEHPRIDNVQIGIMLFYRFYMRRNEFLRLSMNRKDPNRWFYFL